MKRKKLCENICAHIKYTLLMFAAFMLFSFASYAQTKTITGVVIDEENETLIGVTVSIKNTTRGVITDIDGKYSISASVGEDLIFTYLGKTTQTIKVGKENVIDVILVDDATMLGEIEIQVGYGRVKKRDLTGSIVSFTGKELEGVPTNNPVGALQGKVAGLNIINGGVPGSAPTIRLRGVGTLNAKSNPIFVVDGMIVDNIDFVNSSDIVTMEVLKDASSLAIFGVQGANGVIIITTDRGNGKSQVKLNSYVGVQYLMDRDRLKLTDATDFTVLYNEQLRNMKKQPWEGNLLGKGTDWQSEIFRPALITNHHLSISNSSDKSNVMVSAGYYKQDGIIKYSSFDKINLNVAGDIKVNKAIKVGTNVSLNRWSRDPEANGVLLNAVRAFPTYKPYRDEIDISYDNPGGIFTPGPGAQSTIGNPVASANLAKGTVDAYGYRGVGNVYLEIDFLKDFKFKTSGFFDVGVNMNKTYTPVFDVNYTGMNQTTQKNQTAWSSKESIEFTKYQADFILSYNKKIGKNSIDALVGYTAYENKSTGFSGVTSGIFGNKPFLPEDLWTLDPKADNIAVGNVFTQSSFISYLSRVNYSYDNKYLLTATFRSDGSSKFAPDKRWGYFPSVGLGWIISEESFMSSYRESINFLKLKASWGRLGNDKIGDFQNYPTVNPNGSVIIVDGNPIYLPTVANKVDPNLHWEVMAGTDVGVEGSFLNQRLSADLGYYYKKNSDLLATVQAASALGPQNLVTNAGSISNQGFEFNIGWRDKIGEVGYNASFNGSTVRNRVLELNRNNQPVQTGPYHRTAVGHPIGSFFGYVQDGIFQTQEEINAYYPSSWQAATKPGDIRYKDLNNDGVIDDKDRTFLGSPIPKFVYGFSVGAEYKNFDLNVSFNGVSGNKILNQKKIPSFAQFNYYNTALDRWHGPGTSSFEPVLNPEQAHNFLASTNLIESGSYLRLKAIQIGYNVPRSFLQKLQITSLRVYANAENLLTFKHNSGYTPEVGGGIMDGGIDNGSTYPIPATFTGGIILSF